MNILLYIDPGVGSLLIQAAMAAFIAVASFVKFFPAKIAAFLKIFKKGQDND